MISSFLFLYLPLVKGRISSQSFTTQSYIAKNRPNELSDSVAIHFHTINRTQRVISEEYLRAQGIYKLIKVLLNMASSQFVVSFGCKEIFYFCHNLAFHFTSSHSYISVCCKRRICVRGITCPIIESTFISFLSIIWFGNIGNGGKEDQCVYTHTFQMQRSCC